MTTATYSRPNYTADAAASYKAKIDAMARVFERLASAFAPHEQSAGSPAPDLTIVVDAGPVWTGDVLAEKPQQTVTGFTVPASGTRIDRVVLDPATGDARRIAGTAVAGSPSATPPAIPSGSIPICQVAIASTNTAITNSMITDERVIPLLGGALTVGGLLSLSSGQIKFPATQVPSSDPNTLDDYEEGTWTPSIGGSATYTLQAGKYVKIGQLVNIQAELQVDVIGTGSTTSISGLPFTTLAGHEPNGPVGYFAALASSVVFIFVQGGASSTSASFYSLTAAGTGTGLNAIFQNAARVFFSMAYRASA